MTAPIPNTGTSPTERTLGGYARVATLASVAGLRSMLPLFATTIAASRGDAAATYQGQPYALLRTRVALVGLALAAVGEVIGDKLPTTPSRLAPLPLGGRAISGAIVGAVMARRAALSVPTGALLGTIAALGGSLVGYQSRATLGRVTGVPDRVWAFIEDGIAIGLACVVFTDKR